MFRDLLFINGKFEAFNDLGVPAKLTVKKAGSSPAVGLFASSLLVLCYVCRPAVASFGRLLAQQT